MKYPYTFDIVCDIVWFPIIADPNMTVDAVQIVDRSNEYQFLQPL